LILVFGGFHFPRNCDGFFDALADELGPAFALLGYDYYGRGDSAAPRGRYDAAFYLSQIDGLLKALELADRRLVVLGYSFGGSVAVQFTRAHPERVRALILSGAWGAWDPFPAAARYLVRLGFGWVLSLAWWSSTRKAIIEGFADRSIAMPYTHEMLRVEREIVARDPRGFEHAILSTFRDFPTDTRDAVIEIGRHERPVLLVWGEEDNVSPLQGAKAIHAAMPRSRLCVHAGSHNDLWLVPEMAQRLRGELTRFLRALPDD
jgi:pimeloyl-ACP methyl ester carboxylesterase